jgi:hypothetical protein
VSTGKRRCRACRFHRKRMVKGGVPSENARRWCERARECEARAPSPPRARGRALGTMDRTSTHRRLRPGGLPSSALTLERRVGAGGPRGSRNAGVWSDSRARARVERRRECTGRTPDERAYGEMPAPRDAVARRRVQRQGPGAPLEDNGWWQARCGSGCASDVASKNEGAVRRTA